MLSPIWNTYITISSPQDPGVIMTKGMGKVQEPKVINDYQETLPPGCSSKGCTYELPIPVQAQRGPNPNMGKGIGNL